MAPIDDETLDRLLTRHLASRLDGQLGRAEARFRQRLNESGFSALAENESAPLRLANNPQPLEPIRRPATFWTRPYGWMISVVGSAVAASLVTLLLLPAVGPTPAANSPGQVAHTQSSNNPAPSPLVVTPDHPAMRYVHDQTWDEGIVTPEGSDRPLRKVRRHYVEHIRYFDVNRGVYVEQTIPRDDIQWYEMDTY